MHHSCGKNINNCLATELEETQERLIIEGFVQGRGHVEDHPQGTQIS